jgi:signal transduction histidine kinase
MKARAEAPGAEVPSAEVLGAMCQDVETTMRDPQRLQWLEAWERREMPVLTALPYAMLAFCAVLTVLVRHSLGQGWLWDLALCGVAGAWLVALPVGSRLFPDRGTDSGPAGRQSRGSSRGTAHVPAWTAAWTAAWGAGRGPAWRDNPVTQGVFFAGLIAIMTVMVVRDPWFGFFTFTGYFFVGRLPYASWRVIAVIAVAVLTGSSQAGGFSTAAASVTGAAIYAGCVAVNLAVAGASIWFGYVGHIQHVRRARLVDELSEANRKLKATLAENAGLHAQLLTQAREAGVLDERQRMAREIHDTIAQGLTGIITQLQAAEQAGNDVTERRRHFDAAVRLARESLTEARRSVDALRPEPLERARGFGDALAGVAERWSALHGIAVEITTTGTARPLPKETEVVLLRTAQEALANVAKHAAATRMWLTLSYMDCEVALDVRDDGRGFDPDAAASAGAVGRGVNGGSAAGGGFGLVAMRQRVEGQSGTLQVESESGAGTVISVCVPASPPDPATLAAAGRRVA